MLKFIEGEAALAIKTPEGMVLVISDLHLGFEKALAEKGINLPSQTDKILQRIQRLLTQHRPTRLILLGDIKHGTFKILPYEWADIPHFFEKLLSHGATIEVVPGNHDGGLRTLLPRSVLVHSSKGLVIRENARTTALIHGHAWPSPDALSAHRLLMGHNHFTVEFRDRTGVRKTEPIWLVTTWNRERIAQAYLHALHLEYHGPATTAFRHHFSRSVTQPAMIVMPPFNPLLPGTRINTESPPHYLGPLFRSGALQIQRAEIYLLDGTPLGRLPALLQTVET